jgi:transposase
MHYHKNAALTARQRASIQQAYREGATVASLARQFGVDRGTIKRWAERTDTTDRSSAPRQHGRRVVTDTYKEAVLALRRDHPSWGPRRLADELKDCYPTANTATIWRILHQAGLSQRTEKKTQSPVP